MKTQHPNSASDRMQTAGRFSAWLRLTRRAMKTDEGAEVPCGACAACCRASYFIAVGPEERRALARIPQAYLVPEPGRHGGRKLLGHFADGRCPLFRRGGCSIYADRPRTCRQYDCRVFAATRIAPGGPGQAAIAAQVRRWRFSAPSREERRQLAAVRAAARFIVRHPEDFPPGTYPENPAQTAVLAIQAYRCFLKGNAQGGKRADRVRRILAARRAATPRARPIRKRLSVRPKV